MTKAHDERMVVVSLQHESRVVSLRVVLVVAAQLVLVACGLGGHGSNDATTPAATETIIATSTPPSVVDALRASLLPEGEVGTEWSRIPADPSVTRFEGDDVSLRSACAPLRGAASVTSVAGEHLAGPQDSSGSARPQWYETIAVFASPRAVQDYMKSAQLDCTAQGESVEKPYDRIGDASIYVQYGAPGQIHRVMLVRRRNVLMQIRYATYAVSDADEHRFEGLVLAADDRLRAFTVARPDLGESFTPTPGSPRLN